MAEEGTNILVLLGVFLAIAVVVAYLFKRFTKAQVSLILVLLKTTKPIWIFDKLAKHRRFWNTLSDMGLILGFGILGVDFLFTRKKKPAHRAAFLLISAVLLAGFFLFFDFVSSNAFSQNFITKPFFPVLVLLFALFGFSGFILAILAINALEIIYRYFIGQSACPGVGPLIPGVEIPGIPLSPPLWVWIPLFIIMVLHEASHGVLGRMAKVTIKSTGIVLLGFLPVAAFVEPDDKEVEKKTDLEKARFFVAGVASNLGAFAGTFALVFVVGLVLSSVYGPWAQDLKLQSVDGVQLKSVQEKVDVCGTIFPSPAFGVLEPGMKILKINGNEVKTAGQLVAFLRADPDKTVTFTVQKGSQVMDKTITANEHGTFGILVEEIQKPGYVHPQNFIFYQQVTGIFFDFMSWFLLLNLAIALVNFLPVPFFDGGRIVSVLVAPYLHYVHKDKETAQKRLNKFFSGLVLVLFIINFLPVII